MPPRAPHPDDARAKLDEAGQAYSAAREQLDTATAAGITAAHQAQEAGIPITEITRRLGAGRGTVYAWLARTATPKKRDR